MGSAKNKVFIVFAIAVSLLFNTGFSFAPLRVNAPTTFSDVQTGFPFKDVKGHPAEAAIAEMYAKGVMRGYDDNTFKPNKPVTFLEAIVMLDKLFWGKPIPMDFASNEYLHEQFGIPNWAVGYIASGLRNNILMYNELQKVSLQQPLTREDAAVLAVRAMELSNQVKRKQNASLPFSDSIQISENTWGYVVVAWEHKIMAGSPDGNFQPHNPISRAEFAIVLSRLIQQSPALISDETSGFVESVNPLTTTVSLVYSDNKAIQVRLPELSFYYLNDKPSSFEELAAGNYIRIITANPALTTVVISKVVAPDTGAALAVKSVNVSAASAEVQQWTEENKISENYQIKPFNDGLYFLITRGEKMHSGFSVEITKITSVEDEQGIHYRVWTDKSDPARGSIVSPVITYPMALGRIALPTKTIADVTFVNNLNQVIAVINQVTKPEQPK